MKKKTKNRIYKILPYVVFGVLAILFTQYQLRISELRKYKGLTTGRIIDFSRDYRGSGGSVEYEFEVNGKVYRQGNGYPNIKSSKGYDLVGKYFPVIYDTNSVTNNVMLITPKNFESFPVLFPDSLEWVRKYER